MLELTLETVENDEEINKEFAFREWSDKTQYPGKSHCWWQFDAQDRQAGLVTLICHAAGGLCETSRNNRQHFPDIGGFSLMQEKCELSRSRILFIK